jgi:hypothetical protein
MFALPERRIAIDVFVIEPPLICSFDAELETPVVAPEIVTSLTEMPLTELDTATPTDDVLMVDPVRVTPSEAP